MKIFLYLLFVGGWIFCDPMLIHASLFQEKKCSECHRLSNDEAEKNGPDLFYAGNKYQASWLKQYLQNPITIRSAGGVRDSGFLNGIPANTQKHIALPKEEAEQISKELMVLTPFDLPKEVDRLELLTDGQKAKIKYQFERTFGCISCHQSLNLAGKVRGGISGPSLVNAGNRLQARWIESWLKNPKIFTNKSRMPIYKMEGEVRLKLTQFLMTLKNENKR
jgi:cbb3-type cytochrome oxidase cytochrome c subunit